ncbi:Krueppel homolog 1-like isoform X1 [Cloeon dipterum]|uniref:Krueppel homolog 1-like isoform X1 n=2 Tax=Cloeon dipterum TaxID=197152 RepID=UPI00321FB955
MAQPSPSWSKGPPQPPRNPEQVKKLLWLDESLWSKVSEMVGYLHAAEGSTSNSSGAKPEAAPAQSSVNSVVCSPDLEVFASAQYQCALCHKSFAQKNTYQNHMRSHAAPTASTVVLPPATASVQPPGEVSTSTAPSSNGATAGEDPYPCTICGKTFAVPARLTRHFRTHTGEKPYECEYCHKSFSVKENLSVHRRIHTKERPYKCDVCARAFEHSGKLHRHMRIHTGERPHRCNVCGKTFIQSGQLVIHTRTHTGEKPYVCQVCHKGFTCSKQLKVHSRTHTGEKPYACDICGKAFGYNHVLKLHQVAHFGQKVYKCTLCHMTFSSKKAMEAHIKTHSGSNAEAMQAGAQAMVSAPSPLDESPFGQPAAPRAERVSIDPALLTAIDLREGGNVSTGRRHDDEDDSRSSSATPPLHVDEEAATPIEPTVRLCPDPRSMLPAAQTDYLSGGAMPPNYLLLERRKRGASVPPTPPNSNPESPSPASSPDPGADDGAAAPRKRSKMILQRYMQESTTPVRSSSVIRFAQRHAH